VMGSIVNSTGVFYSNNAGFSTEPIDYYDKYSYDASSNLTHGRGKLGDATKETLTNFGSLTGGWNNDYASFPNLKYSWFLRGGGAAVGDSAGAFAFYNYNGGTGSGWGGSRSVLTRK